MGVQLTLTDVTSGFLSATAFTGNNNLIIAAMDKALDRTSTTNNSMQVNLDMANHQIINLPAATLSTEPVRKLEFDTIINNVISGGVSPTLVWTGSQTLVNISELSLGGTGVYNVCYTDTDFTSRFSTVTIHNIPTVTIIAGTSSSRLKNGNTVASSAQFLNFPNAFAASEFTQTTQIGLTITEIWKVL